MASPHDSQCCRNAGVYGINGGQRSIRISWIPSWAGSQVCIFHSGGIVWWLLLLYAAWAGGDYVTALRLPRRANKVSSVEGKQLRSQASI